MPAHLLMMEEGRDNSHRLEAKTDREGLILKKPCIKINGLARGENKFYSETFLEALRSSNAITPCAANR